MRSEVEGEGEHEDEDEWPTILITAREREKLDRLSSHASDEGACNERKR